MLPWVGCSIAGMLHLADGCAIDADIWLFPTSCTLDQVGFCLEVLLVRFLLLTGWVIVITMSSEALEQVLFVGGSCCVVVDVTCLALLFFGTTTHLIFLGGIILCLADVLFAAFG